jgi:hypothetical protein
MSDARDPDRETQPILTAAELTSIPLLAELVEVPEWGGSVYVRELTAAERDAFEAEFYTAAQANQVPPDLKVKLCAMCMLGADRARLFDDDELHVVRSLGAGGVNRVAEAALRINRFSEADVQDLAGN